MAKAVRLEARKLGSNSILPNQLQVIFLEGDLRTAQLYQMVLVFLAMARRLQVSPSV